jgi:hypothetical protein
MFLEIPFYSMLMSSSRSDEDNAEEDEGGTALTSPSASPAFRSQAAAVIDAPAAIFAQVTMRALAREGRTLDGEIEDVNIDVELED